MADELITAEREYRAALEMAHGSLDECFNVRKYSFIDANDMKDEIIIDFLNDIGLKDLAERVRELCQS